MTFATMDGFRREPVMVWNMYRMRQKQIAQAKPNPAHLTLAAMEQHYTEFLIATQNVDDLHERAGSRKLVKIHGDAGQLRCLGCQDVHEAAVFDLPDQFDGETLPKCPTCRELCRPNIVWFGEMVPQGPMAAAINASASCELMLIVGTSGEVSGGYGFAEYATSHGATIVEINPARGHLTQFADFHIAQPAGQALPALWRRVHLAHSDGG
jgi:NAD-dependent deacetylase